MSPVADASGHVAHYTCANGFAEKRAGGTFAGIFRTNGRRYTNIVSSSYWFIVFCSLTAGFQKIKNTIQYKIKGYIHESSPMR